MVSLLYHSATWVPSPVESPRIMASKPTTRGKQAVSISAPRSSLKATDVPGVYRNKAGVLVNESGVAVSFRDVKVADDERFREVLGRDPKLPIDIITGVAMDPRRSIHERLDAAKHAAPYTSPKLISHSGSVGVISTDSERLAAMSMEELKLYRAALENASQILRGAK